MRIGLVSDLHEDHWLLKTGRSAIDAIEGGVCDVLVVAGDLFQYSHDRNMAITKLRNLRDKAPEVIYVPGNHEYYDMHFVEAQQALESACESTDIQFLTGSASYCELGGITFVGGSLWFDLNDKDVKRCLPRWSDSCIEGLLNNIPWYREQEMNTLKRFADPNTVVVTHFLPSYMSVHHQYADDPFNCLFVTQGAEEIMREKQPRLWLHGHTHTPCDYRQYNTRVVCKPLGYPARPNQKPRKMPFVIDTKAGDPK